MGPTSSDKEKVRNAMSPYTIIDLFQVHGWYRQVGSLRNCFGIRDTGCSSHQGPAPQWSSCFNCFSWVWWYTHGLDYFGAYWRMVDRNVSRHTIQANLNRNWPELGTKTASNPLVFSISTPILTSSLGRLFTTCAYSANFAETNLPKTSGLSRPTLANNESRSYRTASGDQCWIWAPDRSPSWNRTRIVLGI